MENEHRIYTSKGSMSNFHKYSPCKSKPENKIKTHASADETPTLSDFNRFQVQCNKLCIHKLMFQILKTQNSF